MGAYLSGRLLYLFQVISAKLEFSISFSSLKHLTTPKQVVIKLQEKTMTKYRLNLLIPSTAHLVRGLMNPRSGTELHKLIKSLSQYDWLLWPHHNVFFLLNDVMI